MTETATLYSTTPATAAQRQKLKATFSDNQNHTLQIDYNGPERLFRIRFGATQRLFFFDELFQKLIFRNEYGVVIGQVSAAQAGGWVHIDKKRYRFSYSGNDSTLSLTRPEMEVALSSNVSNDVLSENLDARHKQNLIHCLAFAFAWTLG